LAKPDPSRILANNDYELTIATDEDCSIYHIQFNRYYFEKNSTIKIMGPQVLPNELIPIQSKLRTFDVVKDNTSGKEHEI
jgi:hypothetical protein